MALDYLDEEAQGIDYLYSLEHAQNNLFFARIDGAEDSKFRISKISLNSTPNISFEKNNNRFLTLAGAKMPDEITITWIEDAYRSVEQFHLKWLRAWYDFRADYIPLGRINKFKNITIESYHYVNRNDSVSAPLMDADRIASITLANCVPTNMGSTMEFDWSAGGIKEFTTTYKFSSITNLDYANNTNGFVDNSSTKNGYLYENPSNVGLGGNYSWSSSSNLVNPSLAWQGDGIKDNARSYTYATTATEEQKIRALELDKDAEAEEQGT